MKHITKPKITKNLFIAIVLSAVFAVLLALSIVITVISSSLDDSDPQTVTEVPPVIDGEARQNGLALAYPSINRKNQIKYIQIENQTGEFGFVMLTGESHHTLYYVDSSGEPIIYYPDICAEDATFNYTDLFAIVTNDGYSQYSLVDYLCLALQSPYFDERIPIETDSAKKDIQLKEFGFTEDKMSKVSFNYTDELGNTVNKSVIIGEKSVTGTGYYFIVYDNGVERPYIYSSLNNYYDYAVTNISSFVKPLLVSEGLAEDSGYGPYLTTGYYQWLNKVHDGSCECDKYECECKGECDADSCECTDTCRVTEVTDDSKVIAYTDVISSVLSEDASSSGYESTGYKVKEIDLGVFKDALEKLKAGANYKPTYESMNYERVIKALSGRKLGEQAEKIAVTMFNTSKLIDFADKNSVRYEYNITAVEAIITDSGELSTPGASAGSQYNAVKVTYTATVDGKSVSAHPLHAVLDLTLPGISAEAVQNIRAAKVGESLNITFAIDYTSENAISKNSKYIITEIIDIFDQEGKEAEKIDENSIVGYRYTVIVDGNEVGEATYWLDLSAVTEGDDLLIKNALKGKSTGKVSLEFDEHYAYYEYFLDFSTYIISRIDYFVTSEIITAFKFQNSSERDPYYGESLYENLLEDERSLYGLSSGVCETVVKILGGLSDENATATAAGLTGDEAVAVGITPEVMKKYGLYAHTIYFELPRGIKALEGETAMDELDDYTFRSTLGFYLYVSDVDPETNTRYIASDLYNIVTRVPAENFVFLNYDFESFWARRNIILMDISQIGSFGIEFNMSDLKGSYNFELTQPSSDEDALGVYVTAQGECTPNKYTQFVSDPKNQAYVYNGGTSLKVLYERAGNASPEEHKAALPDSLGASCFKDAMRMMYYTSYVDILPESERGLKPGSEKLVMRMTLEIEDGTPNASPYTYVYEYYRIDDRRILVSMYQQNSSGVAVTEAVSDFYISTFAFKKIVSNFVGLLNAEVINTDIGYPDELD